MFSKELFSSVIFSRPERTKTETTIKITKTTGTNVIAERCCDIRKKYTARKINDLMNTVILNTAIIERECFKRLIKLIFDGPKYLVPLIDGIDLRSLIVLDNEPEKLLQIAESANILVTSDLGKQV